jgi:hypothetical protein
MKPKKAKITTADRMKLKYGQDYYAKIGSMGGKVGGGKGGFNDRELARRASKLGWESRLKNKEAKVADDARAEG